MRGKESRLLENGSRRTREGRVLKVDLQVLPRHSKLMAVDKEANGTEPLPLPLADLTN